MPVGTTKWNDIVMNDNKGNRMKKDAIKQERDLNEQIERRDMVGGIYALLIVLLAVAAVVFLLRDNRREVTAEGAENYPVAYSALSGSDAWVSPSDIEERADSYIAQFREFDRTYCYEYWVQCQNILAKDPDYAPDVELTLRAREDYERYVVLVREAGEEHRAMVEKIVVCGSLAAAVAVFALLIGVNRLRRLVLVGRLRNQE